MSFRVSAIIALLLSLLLAMSACGNKGPLYLPEEEEEEKLEATEY